MKVPLGKKEYELLTGYQDSEKFRSACLLIRDSDDESIRNKSDNRAELEKDLNVKIRPCKKRRFF